MCDLTMLAFDLADRYRNPAVLLADGFIGQIWNRSTSRSGDKSAAQTVGRRGDRGYTR